MTSNHETTWTRLTEYIVELMAKKKVPGVAVGLLYQGETKSAGFGVTNVKHPLDVTAETLFQIGSITKTFTGTAIMRLVEMGKLELEAPVRRYLPEFKVADETASAQTTVRHLLTHMSGWVGDHFHDTGAGDDAVAKYVASMAELEQLAPLDTVWSYNNSGFAVAGAIIEAVTGKNFQAALKELVLEPLGMENSYFDPGEIMIHRFATGHNIGEEEPQVATPWPLPRGIYAAGGITCSMNDLLRYARFHLGDGSVDNETRLLLPKSLARMHTPQVKVWQDESWGLTWAIDDTWGKRLLSHGGGTVGQISLLMLVPEEDFAIAIFTNANRGGQITGDVSRWALKEYLGLEISDPEPIEATEEELASFTGHYERPFANIDLGLLGGKLIAQLTYKGRFPTQDSPPPPPLPPMSLGLTGKGSLLVLDGPFKDMQVHIIRTPDGGIGWLRAGGRIYRRRQI